MLTFLPRIADRSPREYYCMFQQFLGGVVVYTKVKVAEKNKIRFNFLRNMLAPVLVYFTELS